MAEITSSPTVSIQSLLYPSTTETQTTTPTTQTDPLATTLLVSPDTSILPSSTRGYSAATLGLTPPRPGGAAEADLLAIRQMLDDMNGDMRDNEIMASTQRKATALGGALSLIGGMVSSMSTAIALTVELPYAIETAKQTKADYETKKKAADDIATELQPITNEFNQLTSDIAQANLAIQSLTSQIASKDTSIQTTTNSLNQANSELTTINNNLTAKTQQIASLQLQLAATTNPATRASLQSQINTATAEKQQLQTQQTNKQTEVNNLNGQLSQLQTDRAGLVNSRQAKIDLVATSQARLDVITPTKLQLEAKLSTARQVENEARVVWSAAQSYADGIPARINQAFADFAATLNGFTLQAQRLTTVPNMPDGGIEAELNALKKENAEGLEELWKIMSDAREKLGADVEINDAINSRLSELDEVRRAKVGLAFSSIFTSLLDALTNLSVLMDPASTTGGNNFSERQPQRMRFAIGGSA